MKITVKIEETTFEVEVGDLNARPILATVDGDTFEVWPEQLGPVPAPAVHVTQPPVSVSVPVITPTGTAVVDKNKTVVAPIPGVIIAIKVKPGDKVVYGQELCILEAMKMKNAIRTTREGSIGAVLVSIGDHVRHGQPLLEFTD